MATVLVAPCNRSRCIAKVASAAVTARTFHHHAENWWPMLNKTMPLQGKSDRVICETAHCFSSAPPLTTADRRRVRNGSNHSMHRRVLRQETLLPRVLLGPL